MKLPTIAETIGADIHAPRLWELYREGNWAALVRYWFAHQHKPAMRVAVRILGPDLDGKTSERIEHVAVAVVLNTLLINTNSKHHLAFRMPQFHGSWTCEEKLTLDFIRLLPEIELCERGLLEPIKKQTSLLSAGLRAAEKACQIMKALDDLPALGMLRSMMASTLTHLRQPEPARRHYVEALSLRRLLFEQKPEVYRGDLALTLMNHGNLHSECGEPEKARGVMEEALALYREAAGIAPDLHLQDLILCLSNLGGVEQRLGEVRSALNHLEEAVSLSRQTFRDASPAFLSKVAGEIHGHPGVQLAFALVNLGSIRYAGGDNAAAREAMEEAATILGPLAEEGPEYLGHLLATILNNLGLLDVRDEGASTSRFEEAVDRYSRLARKQPVVFKIYLASSLANLGASQLAEGERAKGKISLLEARRLFAEDARERPTAALENYMHCCTTLGRLYLENDDDLGLPDREAALTSLRQACELAESSRQVFLNPAQRERFHERSLAAYELRFRSLVEIWQSSGGSDFRALQEAMEVAEASRARNLNDLLAAETLVPQGVPRHAADRFRAIRGRLHQLERDLFEIRSGGFGTPRPGVANLIHLEAEAETLRRQYSQELAILRNDYDPGFDPDRPLRPIDFTMIVELLPRDVPTALVQYNLGVESAFAIVVTSSDMTILQLPGLKEREVMLLALEWLEGYARRRSNFIEVLRERRRREGSNPVYRRRLASLKAMAEAGVFERLGQEDDSLFEREHAKSHSDPEEWYEEVLGQAFRRDQLGGIAQDWTTLLPHLLQPVAELAVHPVVKALEGRGIRRLIISPNRALRVFPLHACRLDKVPYVRGANPLAVAISELEACKEGSPPAARYLADEYEVLYVPSFSILHHCARRMCEQDGRNQLLTVENPTYDLPFAGIEQVSIGRHFASPPHLLRGRQATWEALLDVADRCTVLHYCGHSRFDVEDPLNSGLLLGHRDKWGRWVTLREIFVDLRLPSNRLTVLGGCEGAMLLPDRVDETISLSSGFLYAGASCVLSSLWEAPDFPTALLMDRFYQEWCGIGSAASALREAQRWLREGIRSGEHLLEEVLPPFLARLEDPDLRQLCGERAAMYARRHPGQPPFASPAFWAPFIVTGWGLSPSALESRDLVRQVRPERSNRQGRQLGPEEESRDDLCGLGVVAETAVADSVVGRISYHARRRGTGGVKGLLLSFGLADRLQEQLGSLKEGCSARSRESFDRGLEQMKARDLRASLRTFEEALASLRSEKDLPSAGFCLVVMGHLHLAMNASEAALDAFGKGADLDLPEEVRTMLFEGLFEAATSHVEDCHETIWEQLEDPEEESRFGALEQRIHEAVRTAMECGEVDQLDSLLAETLEGGDPRHELSVVFARAMAELHRFDGKPDQEWEGRLRSLWEQARSALHRIDPAEQPPWQGLLRALPRVEEARLFLALKAHSLRSEGLGELQVGNHDAAVERIEAGVRLSRTLGSKEYIVLNLLSLVHVLLKVGRPAAARPHLFEAKRTAEELGIPRLVELVDQLLVQAGSEV